MWTETRLKHVCTDSGQYGLNISADQYVDEGIRLIRTSDISEDGGLRSADSGVFVSVPLEDRHRLKTGDILLSRSGTLGRSFIVPSEAEGDTFAGFLVRFRPRMNVSQRFIFYVTRSQTFQAYVKSEAVSSTIQNFNADRYANVPIHIPPFGEQCRIAEVLDAETSRFDRLVDASARLRALALERRTSGVISAVAGSHIVNRRASSLAWLQTVPAEWDEVRLGLVAQMGSGHTPSRNRPEWWVDCTIPWITTGEVHLIRNDRLEDLAATRESISKVGLANSAAELHPKGTVVLSRTASAGYSAVMGTDMATSQDFVTWTCGPRIDPYYLLWCLRAMRSDLLGRLAMGSTHKTIYVPDLQALKIPLPPIEEQRRIVAQIRRQTSAIDSLVDSIDRKLALLAERRQALITAAVTGQFDVTTASGRNTTRGV